MNKVLCCLVFAVLLFLKPIDAQPGYFPLDSLSRDDIVLEQIDLRFGNTYRFKTLVIKDSIFLNIPTFLPKGYYEVYYDNDTNRLALTYYNFGNKSYCQQFYKDGSMKSDSEYDRYGNMHGLHVLYNQNGDEIWHADYWHGSLELKYSLEYTEVFNYTEELIKNGKAWGCFEFSPTPMRERHDQIQLRADGTFSFHNFKADCDCSRHAEGKWFLKDKLLHLTADKKDVWPSGNSRKFAIIANRKAKNPVLVEVMPWGANWYGSEFWLCKKCNCISDHGN